MFLPSYNLVNFITRDHATWRKKIAQYTFFPDMLYDICIFSARKILLYYHDIHSCHMPINWVVQNFGKGIGIRRPWLQYLKATCGFRPWQNLLSSLFKFGTLNANVWVADKYKEPQPTKCLRRISAINSTFNVKRKVELLRDWNLVQHNPFTIVSFWDGTRDDTP